MVKKLAGTQPWMTVPRSMPTRRWGQILRRIVPTSSTPIWIRSSKDWPVVDSTTRWPKTQPPTIAMLRPAATKLISAGMALQEQDGVTTPKPVNTPPKPWRSTAAESGCAAAWTAPGCARSINVVAESFLATLKNEMYYRYRFPTRARARFAVAEYIEVFYNRKRMHSSIGYRTPTQALTNYQMAAVAA